MDNNDLRQHYNGIERAMKKVVYLSLGSNMGDREQNLRTALDRLAGLGTLPAVSSFYETEPVDYAAQPWFLNCAAALETTLMPKQLLARTQHIEQELGRRRGSLAPAPSRIKGPRPIDIDILLFGRFIIDTAGLVVPHPAMHERRFVLDPLAEIAPEVRHPLLKLTVRQMRDAAAKSNQTVKRVAQPYWPNRAGNSLEADASYSAGDEQERVSRGRF